MKKKIFAIAKKALGVFFAICFAIVVVQRIKGEIPTLFNHSVFVIITDSMTPKYKPEDVILVRHIDPSKIEKGDVVTYMGVTDEYAGKIITHKVVEDPYQDESGIYHFQTQGIKEMAPYDPPITENELIGRVSTKLRVITLLYKAFTNLYGFIFLIVIPLGVIMVMELIQLRKNEKNKIIEEMEEELKHVKDKENKLN